MRHKQHTAQLPTSLQQGPCGVAGFQGEISNQTALAALDSCAHMLGRRFDPKQGGFGKAPKFPRPAEINALLHDHLRSDSTDPGTWRVPDMLPGSVPDPHNAFHQGMFHILMRYPVLKRCYVLLMYIHRSLLCMPSGQGSFHRQMHYVQRLNFVRCAAHVRRSQPEHGSVQPAQDGGWRDVRPCR
jgi:hypothetical protein